MPSKPIIKPHKETTLITLKSYVASVRVQVGKRFIPDGSNEKILRTRYLREVRAGLRLMTFLETREDPGAEQGGHGVTVPWSNYCY